MKQHLHVVCPDCASVNRIPPSKRLDQGKCGRCAKPLFTGKAHPVDTAGFRRQVARSDIPVLVDFWADWCGPCHTMAPAFEQAVKNLEPRVRLLKLNTENERSLAAELNIRSIPTLALFAHGEEVNRVSGVMDASGIVEWVRRQL